MPKQRRTHRRNAERSIKFVLDYFRVTRASDDSCPPNASHDVRRVWEALGVIEDQHPSEELARAIRLLLEHALCTVARVDSSKPWFIAIQEALARIEAANAPPMTATALPTATKGTRT